MRTSVTTNVLSKLLIYGLLVVLAVERIQAQQSAARMESAVLTNQSDGIQKVTLVFSESFAPGDVAAAQIPHNYFVMDMASQRVVKVMGTPEVPNIPGLFSPIVSFILCTDPCAPCTDPSCKTPKVNLDDAQASYYVFAVNLTFGGKPPKGLLQTKLKKDRSEPITLASEPPLAFKASKGRNDSSIYIAGEITRASGTDTYSSIDIKVEYPLAPKNYWNRDHTFAPVFDLRASNNPKADPDSMTFGGLWVFNLDRSKASVAPSGAASGSIYSNTFWENAGKIEAERDFDNVNAIWSSRFIIPLNLINTRRTKLTIDPFFGTELGRNLQSPLAVANGKPLARPLIGAAMVAAFPLQRNGVNPLTFESNYIRRWPLYEEVSLQANSDGSLKAILHNTKPKDFVEAKFNYQFNDFFGMYTGYEYGSLPPSYKLVDHRFRLGLVYKVKVERK